MWGPHTSTMAAIPKFEILRSVILLVTVLVMHGLIWAEITSNQTFHYQTVL